MLLKFSDEDNNGKEMWAYYCPKLWDEGAFGLNMIPPHFKLELLKEAFLRLITISLDKNEWILSWSEEGAMELRWPDNVHWTHSKDIGKHRYIYESLFDQIKSGMQMNKWVVTNNYRVTSITGPSELRPWLTIIIRLSSRASLSQLILDTWRKQKSPSQAPTKGAKLRGEAGTCSGVPTTVSVWS